MDYANTAILLLFVGLATVFAEIFIPSGGLLGIVAVVCTLASIVCAWNAWWGDAPAYFWMFVGATVTAFPLCLAAALYVFPSTPVGRAALLEPPKLEDVAAVSEHELRLRELVGETGKTVNLLTPGGIVLVNGERMHCESEGMIIDPGTLVDIVGTKGPRLVVRTHVEKPAEPEDFGASPEGEVEPPLDFEMTQG